jgi:hypothetical protein
LAYRPVRETIAELMTKLQAAMPIAEAARLVMKLERYGMRELLNYADVAGMNMKGARAPKEKVLERLLGGAYVEPDIRYAFKA